MVIWNIFPCLVCCTEKNLATLACGRFHNFSVESAFAVKPLIPVVVFAADVGVGSIDQFIFFVKVCM
jgi:hypothetical protein